MWLPTPPQAEMENEAQAGGRSWETSGGPHSPGGRILAAEGSAWLMSLLSFLSPTEYKVRCSCSKEQLPAGGASTTQRESRRRVPVSPGPSGGSFALCPQCPTFIPLHPSPDSPVLGRWGSNQSPSPPATVPALGQTELSPGWGTEKGGCAGGPLLTLFPGLLPVSQSEQAIPEPLR